MDIVENMKKWDAWDPIVKDIFEKMKKWDTWDAKMKDLRPYFDGVVERMKKRDEPIIQDFYIFKLIIIPKVDAEFYKASDEFHDAGTALEKAYSDVVADIVKLHPNSDKLDDVLEAQTQLLDFEKDKIRRDWKKHAVETKGDEKSVVEDSHMGEYLKAKFTELGNCKAKIDEICDRKMEMYQFWAAINLLRNCLRRCCITRKPPDSRDLRKEHKKRIQNMIQNMMRAEDNIVASSEDNICRPKRQKLDRC